ncbi:MAG TPA: hypothetical protein VLH15_02550, partial [Dehalococcoidales bacterium]|nr:hypothetical protein [Dehalococcoidales bacterium]
MIRKSGILKTALVLSLTLILCLALVIPAMAGDSTKTPAAAAASAKNLVKGKIASIADDQKTFEVLTSNGSVVVISVDSETRYYKIDSTAPVIARIKEKAQEQTKTKQENASKNKDNKTAVSDQRGKKDSESVANNKLKGPTAKLQDEDDDIDYEEDPAVEKLLDAETQDVNNIWGRLKSFFNRSPKAGQKGEFSDLAIGDGVVVKVMPNENLAKQVLIIKAPNIINVKGEITEVTATTFTITP